MSIKAMLNRCYPIRYFVYGAARCVGEQMHVVVRPRAGALGHCGECGRRGPTDDTSRHPRLFEFVPLWGYVVFLVYRMRRIHCSTCGVRTEQVPGADGKNRCCNVYRLFLARWARRVSWSEVALGVVEGMNTNAKLAIRKARGFRTYELLETALYHELGRLPESVFTNRFC